MKGFKLSPVHLPPIHKVKVKRRHYRLILFFTSTAIVAAHYYTPDFEIHVAYAVNILFLIDPTV